MIDIYKELNPNSALIRPAHPTHRSKSRGTLVISEGSSRHELLKCSDSSVDLNSQIDLATTSNLDSLQRKAINDLESYLNLEPGWDLYFAKKVDLRALSVAQEMINSIANDLKSNLVEIKKISVGPGADGSVGIEIQTKDKTVLIDIDAERNEVELHKIDQKSEFGQSYPINEVDMGEISEWLAS